MTESHRVSSVLQIRFCLVLVALGVLAGTIAGLCWFLARTGIRAMTAAGAEVWYEVPEHVFWGDHVFTREPALWHTDRCVVDVTFSSLSAGRFGDGDAMHLVRFPNLEELRLTRASVSSRGFEALHGLPQLKFLELEEMAVSSADLEGFGSLRSLSLDGVTLTEARLAAATTRPQLVLLSLARTNFADADVAALASCPDLEYLDLSGTRITDVGVLQIGRTCPDLRILIVQETEVTDTCLDVVDRLPRLEEMYLDGTAVTDRELERRHAADSTFAGFKLSTLLRDSTSRDAGE